MPHQDSHSLRRKFFFHLTLVITILLFIFTAALIFLYAEKQNKNLNDHTDLLLNLSQESLAGALWQYNTEYANDYVSALLNDNKVAYVSISQGNKITSTKTRKKFAHIDFTSGNDISGFLIKSRDINYKGAKIGVITIGITLEKIKKTILVNSIVSIIFLLLLVLAIFTVTYIISKKYIFKPLNNLKDSAERISEGNFDTPIDLKSSDEIGQLAQKFKVMIDNIKVITASKEELNKEIDARLLSEESLQRSHQTLLSVLDGAHATIYVARIDTHEILFMNKHMIDIYGADSTGKKCFDAFAEFTDCSDCKNALLLGQDELPMDVQVSSRYNPKLQRWFMNHDRAIKWIDGEYVHLQIATDITESKHLEEELRQAHKMESVGRLAGGIAHDFNNILAAIQGFSELALESIPADNSAVEDIQEVLSSSKRAAKLVAQILSFSRKEHQTLTPINFEDITKESIVLLRATLPSTIQIHEHFTLTNKTIMGDPTMIHQVIVNICTNSSHALENNSGTIALDLTNVKADDIPPQNPPLVEGDYICLKITDSGVGINAEHLERVFEPYFTTKDVGKGSGMGLAVVHGVVQSHNGVIDIASTVNHGTSISIYFPICTESTAIIENLKKELPRGSERILVIDDEAAVVTMTRRRLEQLGYTVTGSVSSPEALALFQSSPTEFDLVISDQTMPILPGNQLAEQMRLIRPDIPIIISSGYSLDLNHSKASELKLNGFIAKPVSPTTLASTVRNVLDDTPTRQNITK